MTARGVRVELYDETGLTRLAVLDKARAVTWQWVLSRNGTCTFEVPLDDAKTALLTDRRIVKFRWRGKTFGARLGPTEKCAHAVDGGRWLRFEGLPGLGALLGDAPVLPEYGFARTSSADRGFGPYSLDGAWRVPSDWVTPQTLPWRDVTGKRAGHPPEVGAISPTAAWIAPVSPRAGQVAGYTFWARATLTLAADTSVRILVTGDNYTDFWLNGEHLLAPSDEIHVWRTFQTFDQVLAAGVHQLAGKVVNAYSPEGDSPVGFLCVAVTLNEAGEVDETSEVLLQTDATHWLVHDNSPEPGWRRAQVLHQAVTEAVAADYLGPGLLTLGFTASADSDGEAYTDPPGEFRFGVAAFGLDELAAQLASSGIDWLVDADDMTVNVYARYGQDRSSGAGAVRLFLARDFRQYDTERLANHRNTAIAQLADGSWLETVDTTAVTAMGGKVFLGVSLGTTSSQQTGEDISLAELGRTATPQLAATSQAGTLVGAELGVDYWLGDTILIPGHPEPNGSGGSMPARVLSVTVDASGDVVRAWPEFTADGSV